jgi:hypothetical protein
MKVFNTTKIYEQLNDGVLWCYVNAPTCFVDVPLTFLHASLTFFENLLIFYDVPVMHLKALLMHEIKKESLEKPN